MRLAAWIFGAALTVYLVWAFVLADFNPFRWSESERFALCIWIAAATFVIVGTHVWKMITKTLPAPTPIQGPNSAAAQRAAQLAEIRRQLGPTGKERTR